MNNKKTVKVSKDLEITVMTIYGLDEEQNQEVRGVVYLPNTAYSEMVEDVERIQISQPRGIVRIELEVYTLGELIRIKHSQSIVREYNQVFLEEFRKLTGFNFIVLDYVMYMTILFEGNNYEPTSELVDYIEITYQGEFPWVGLIEYEEVEEEYFEEEEIEEGELFWQEKFLSIMGDNSEKERGKRESEKDIGYDLVMTPFSDWGGSSSESPVIFSLDLLKLCQWVIENREYSKSVYQSAEDMRDKVKEEFRETGRSEVSISMNKSKCWDSYRIKKRKVLK